MVAVGVEEVLAYEAAGYQVKREKRGVAVTSMAAERELIKCAQALQFTVKGVVKQLGGGAWDRARVNRGSEAAVAGVL